MSQKTNIIPDRHQRAALEKIVRVISRMQSAMDIPIVVAIDGGSGAGKSTIASLIASMVAAAVIPLDDFYAGDIPDALWPEFSVREKLNNVFQWDRLRADVIEPLKSGRKARWFAFDFESGFRNDGTYGMEETPKVREPADIVLIEGAYSASPNISDLVDLTILIDVPVEERHARLASRQEADFSDSWHKIWDEVEDYYFNQVRPKSSFDFVLRG